MTPIPFYLPGSKQWGRVILSTARFREQDLRDEFARGFVEEGDRERLLLLERALAVPEIVVDVYPGEAEPVAHYCYVRSPTVSSERQFACVLATTAVVEELLTHPPYVVFETASFEVIGAEASAAAMTAGIESWVKRVWPRMVVPRIEIVVWAPPA